MDVSHRDYYQQGIKSPFLFWSQVYLSLSTEIPTITVSLPWEQGLIVGYIKLEELNNTIDEIELGGTGQIIITDTLGIVIAHPNRDLVLLRTNVNYLLPIKKGIAGETGTFEYYFEDEKHLGSITRIESLGWLVLVDQKEEDLYSTQTDTLMLLLFTVLGQIGLVIFMSLLSVSFAFAPIKKLTNLTAEISEGNYSVTIDPDWRFREISKVMEGFERMISAVKFRESELRSLRNYLNNIIDSMPSALIGLDIDYKITLINTEAEKLLGIKSSAAIGENIFTLAPMFFEDEKRTLDLLSNKQIITMKKSLSLSGMEKNLDYTFYPLISDESKEIDGAVIRIDDKTTSHKMEQQLIQSQKMDTIGNLAGGLAHDFNNLLTGVITTTSMLKQILKKESPDYNRIGSYVNIIDETGVRAVQLVKQLLSLSRRTELKTNTVEINTIISRVLNICRNSFSKLIQIESQFPDFKCFVDVDQGQMEQVFLNLCINASHAMTTMRSSSEEHGGKLTISVSTYNPDKHFYALNLNATESEYVLIKIMDTGVGMSPSTKERIFEPFFSTKERGEGTGLD